MLVFMSFLGLGKWVEVGNSGVFRPEMLLPMGLPENLSVIAWGLSLERYSVVLLPTVQNHHAAMSFVLFYSFRPTMIKYGISNIRDLFGHKVDLEMVKRNPICRLDS